MSDIFLHISNNKRCFIFIIHQFLWLMSFLHGLLSNNEQKCCKMPYKDAYNIFVGYIVSTILMRNRHLLILIIHGKEALLHAKNRYILLCVSYHIDYIGLTVDNKVPLYVLTVCYTLMLKGLNKRRVPVNGHCVS